MDKDRLIRDLERVLLIRALQSLDDTSPSLVECERAFALEALDLMRRQPAMEELLELG